MSALPMLSEFQLRRAAQVADRKTYNDGYRACGAVNAYDLAREFARGVRQGAHIGFVIGTCFGVTFTIFAAPLIARWFL
ncbi:MAG: hypothetical protein M3R16_09625 [Pseudomonadota bacterium]|nr:hypothetical protein [Pseudomonadota bacterium]